MMKKSVVSTSQEMSALLEATDKDTRHVLKPVFRRVQKKIIEKDMPFFSFMKHQQGMIGEGQVVMLPGWATLGKYEVKCENCKENLAFFFGETEDINEGVGVQLASWHNKDNWFGCLGANVNPETGMINFECCCGNKVVMHNGGVTVYKDGKEDSVSSNLLRYTKYYVQKIHDNN